MKSKFVKVKVERQIDANYGLYSFIILTICNMFFLLYIAYNYDYNKLEMIGLICISFYIVYVLSYIISYICGYSYVKIKR